MAKYRDTRSHPTPEVQDIIDQLTGAVQRLVPKRQRPYVLDLANRLRLRSWDDAYRQGMDDTDQLHRQRAALVTRARVDRPTSDLLGDVKALQQAVAYGQGMSLDNDHAQAVIDAIVKMQALMDEARRGPYIGHTTGEGRRPMLFDPNAAGEAPTSG